MSILRKRLPDVRRDDEDLIETNRLRQRFIVPIATGIVATGSAIYGAFWQMPKLFRGANSGNTIYDSFVLALATLDAVLCGKISARESSRARRHETKYDLLESEDGAKVGYGVEDDLLRVEEVADTATSTSYTTGVISKDTAITRLGVVDMIDRVRVQAASESGKRVASLTLHRSN